MITLDCQFTLIAKIPIAECPIAKVPIAECPIANIPIAECPIAKIPIAECLIAECPIAQLQSIRTYYNVKCQNPQVCFESHCTLKCFWSTLVEFELTGHRKILSVKLMLEMLKHYYR